MTISNPFQNFWVPNGWSSWHRAIDYATPQGTVFTSPADGIYRRRPSELRTDIPGQAGHYGDIELADGRRIRVCHLERHIAADGAVVQRGVTRIGATGNTGTSSGPHMHTTGFYADGTRWNWTLEAGAAPADTDEKPLPTPTPAPVPEIPEKEDDTMKVFGYIKPGDKRTTYVTMDFTGGLWDEFVTDDVEYARSVAENWGNGAPLLSVMHRNSLRAKFEKRWPGN